MTIKQTDEIKFLTIDAAPAGAYDFVPYNDITPLEAAYVAHFFAMFITGTRPENYPNWYIIERHFKEIT